MYILYIYIFYVSLRPFLYLLLILVHSNTKVKMQFKLDKKKGVFFKRKVRTLKEDRERHKNTHVQECTVYQYTNIIF